MQNNSSQNHLELNNQPMMQPPNQIHIWNMVFVTNMNTKMNLWTKQSQ